MHIAWSPTVLIDFPAQQSDPVITIQQRTFITFHFISFHKVIEFGANREPVYDFLLAINSNPGLILHRYRDTAIYWSKIANFAHPLSFSALVQGDPLRIYGKALRFLKLESSGQPTVKIW